MSKHIHLSSLELVRKEEVGNTLFEFALLAYRINVSGFYIIGQ